MAEGRSNWGVKFVLWKIWRTIEKMEGEKERNAITAALIMSTSIMISIAVLSSTDLQKANLMILQAFVILETMAVYSSMGVLVIDLLTERKRQYHSVVVLMSFGCCLAGAILASSLLNFSVFPCSHNLSVLAEKKLKGDFNASY